MAGLNQKDSIHHALGVALLVLRLVLCSFLFSSGPRFLVITTAMDQKDPWPFWLKPFPVQTCAVFFPFTSVSGFVLSKCLHPSFVVSHLFSWQVLMMGPMCLFLLCLVPLRIMVLLMVLALISTRSIDAQFKELRDILLPLARGLADFDNHIKTLSEAVGMVTYRITSVEQTVNALSAKMALFAAMEQNVSTLTENVNSLTARMCKIETNATSVSSGSDSARSWNILGHSNGSTATGSLGSHGPGSSDDKRNTRRGLDTFSNTEDEQSRSAVLLRLPCEQYHKGITKWINNHWENPTCLPTTNPSEFIAKQVLCRPDSYSQQEPNVSTLWPEIKMMVSPFEMNSPFCRAKATVTVRQYHLKTGRSESKLRLCGECWQIS